MSSRDRAVADSRVESGNIVKVLPRGDGFERFAAHEPFGRQVVSAHGPGQLFAAGFNCLFPPFLGEPLADLVACTRRSDKGQPVAAGACVFVLRGEDLNNVAVLQRGVQRQKSSVDAGADCLVPHLGVNGVGEVNRRRTGRQRNDVALRCEGVDVLRTDLVAQAVEKFIRVLDVLLPVHQLTQPRHLVDFTAVADFRSPGPGSPKSSCSAAPVLVLPVGCDTELCPAVHFAGANLNFNRLAVRADHSRVQTLVHVELRHRNVVLEATGNRTPVRVDKAKNRIAFADGFNQHAHAHEVVDVFEIVAADDHLLVDRVVVLGPAGDVRINVRFSKFRTEFLRDDAQVFVAFGSAFGHQAHNLGIHLGVEHLERQVLKLPLDGIHTEAVSQGCVDVEGFACLAR